MKFLALGLLFFLNYASAADAQNLKVDTLHISKLRPGSRMTDIGRATQGKIDTLIWEGAENPSLLKFTTTAFGNVGELRVATKLYEVDQLTFSIAGRDSADAARIFLKVEKDLKVKLGDPSEQYDNILHVTKWIGPSHTLLLKCSDRTNYVSLVLANTGKPRVETPDPGMTPSEVQPTRKRQK